MYEVSYCSVSSFVSFRLGFWKTRIKLSHSNYKKPIISIISVTKQEQEKTLIQKPLINFEFHYKPSDDPM